MNDIELNLSDMNWCKATIEQQAERINVLHMTYTEAYTLLGEVQAKLAALRSKIENAEVVAEVQRERGLTYGGRGALPVGTKLIRKEDLLK